MAESVFGKPIDNAVKELNSKLPSFSSTQLCTASGSSVDSNYTVNDLNGFDWLLLGKYDTSTNAMYNSVIIPVKLFKAYNSTSHAWGMDFFDKSGAREYGYANYVNDTKINLQSNKNGIVVYGIK